MDYYLYQLGRDALKTISTIQAGTTAISSSSARDLRVTQNGTYRDPIAPEVELSNYVNNTASEDGTYVIVQEHREWVERVPQPPTDAEVYAQVEREKRKFQVVLASAAGAVALVGAFVYFDRTSGGKIAKRAANALSEV